jgi:hypothetical protein
MSAAQTTVITTTPPKSRQSLVGGVSDSSATAPQARNIVIEHANAALAKLNRVFIGPLLLKLNN